MQVAGTVREPLSEPDNTFDKFPIVVYLWKRFRDRGRLETYQSKRVQKRPFIYVETVERERYEYILFIESRAQSCPDRRVS
jgi:hypothetical protein